ncbi:hypothetical protein F383_33005 [Gossypium arboreum]|uniref:Uncharacterized protein n=1 Tax=Gossypium arboreum TaxID=29729 RepID=A0A0B0N4B7_GOSAR|nr:hypothetical protein F383_33005 [Gossypium arboreum]
MYRLDYSLKCWILVLYNLSHTKMA